jgi:SAM-dependent methyltransferase
MSERQKEPYQIPEFHQRLETYIGDEKAAVEKDVYRFFWNKIVGSKFLPKSVLDVGCATGDLLAFLNSRQPTATLTGLDLEPTLIAAARKRPELQSAELVTGDALTSLVGKFDLVTCFGMLGVFDEFEALLENLVANTAKGGRLYIQALLNPDDIDVRIAYRDNLNAKDWMRGFNIFSRERVRDWCNESGLTVQFYEFQMTSDLPRRPHLPHRAYTMDLEDGSRRTSNGLCLLLPETLMEIHVPA